jgi:hypothetical protein
MTGIEPQHDAAISLNGGGTTPIVQAKTTIKASLINSARGCCLRFARLPVRRICRYLKRQELTALATVALAVATTLLAIWTHLDAAEQAVISRHQLGVMEAGLRPWISIQPNGHSALTWDERGMRITVEFGLKNVGKSPTTNLFFEAKLALPSKTGTIDTVKMMTDYADGIRKRRTDTPLAGDILFPGQTHQVAMGMLLTRDQIKLLVGNDDGAPITPRIIACADYTFVSGDSKRSCTSAYISALKPEKPGMAFVIMMKDGDLSSDRVVIDPTFYNYAD